MFGKRLIEFVVYTNLWISIGAVSFTSLFYTLQGLPIDYNYLLFIFSSTLLTYTFQRYMKLIYRENIVGPRMLWMEMNKGVIKSTLILGIIGTAFSVVFLSITSILVLAIMGVISFFYAFKIGQKRRSNLRDVPGIKIFLIAVVWALSSAVIPAIEMETLNGQSILVGVGFFLYIIGITIPFDIRDLDYDEPSKYTIPQIFGEGTSKLIASSLLMMSYICFAFPNFNNYGLTLGIALSVILVLTSSKNRNELYFSFILDGLLIALPISVYLLQIL